MGDVKSFECAVQSLPPAELAEFDGKIWDGKIEQDAATGKLDPLASEALADYRAGTKRRI